MIVTVNIEKRELLAESNLTFYIFLVRVNANYLFKPTYLEFHKKN